MRQNTDSSVNDKSPQKNSRISDQFLRVSPYPNTNTNNNNNGPSTSGSGANLNLNTNTRHSAFNVLLIFNHINY